MNRKTRAEMFRRFRLANPEPTTELEYTTPFELPTDRSVNRVTRSLYPVANTPEAILALGEEALCEHVKTIGLYRAKAANVIKTCRLLVERHGGAVPDTLEALQALPGVGRKTANVILNTVFRQPAMAVDTHIFRLSNRTGLAPGKTVLEVERKLLKNVPREYLLDAHHWLILHGRYVCTARKPRCAECIVCDLCDYRHKTAECSPEIIGQFTTPETTTHVRE
ncbi:MAG: endonuclease III [Halothiobacillaceae bacterium]